MNRDDLLYAIEEEASYQKLIDVLRAVVELHKPMTHKGYEETGLFCDNCDFDYPCPTIQAIEKELG